MKQSNNSPESEDPIYQMIEAILSDLKDKETTYEDLVEMHSHALKVYPELLKFEVSLTKKLNEILGPMRSEFNKYELINAEVLGRKTIRDLQAKIRATENIILSVNDLFGNDMHLMVVNDEDKPEIVTYKGRSNSKLVEALRIQK